MNLKKYKVVATFALSAGFIFSGLAVQAASDEEHTAEWYLDQARPYMMLSCESAWDLVDQDVDKFVELIGTISAVSFYNHDFDLERLTNLPEEKREQLVKEFYEGIGEYSKENPQTLLAAVVDFALMDAIAKVKAEEEKSESP
jgi:hypothetical protein